MSNDFYHLSTRVFWSTKQIISRRKQVMYAQVDFVVTVTLESFGWFDLIDLYGYGALVMAL